MFQLGKNDVTRGQANSIGVLSDQIVRKPEELTYLSLNIWVNYWPDVTNTPVYSNGASMAIEKKVL